MRIRSVQNSIEDKPVTIVGGKWESGGERGVGRGRGEGAGKLRNSEVKLRWWVVGGGGGGGGGGMRGFS